MKVNRSEYFSIVEQDEDFPLYSLRRLTGKQVVDVEVWPTEDGGYQGFDILFSDGTTMGLNGNGDDNVWVTEGNAKFLVPYEDLLDEDDAEEN